jgi:hypothetical protein
MSFPIPIVSTDVPVMVIADPPESQRGPERDSPQQRVRRRLRPLYVAALFQGAVLWVPIEKLFLNEIGFDSAKVGVMAAAYAAAVPFLEIPSGILADRWSRRGVLILANIALMLASAIGGASNSFANYLVSAVMLVSSSRCSQGRWIRSSTTPCSRRPATVKGSRRRSGACDSWRALRSSPARCSEGGSPS